MNTTSLKRSIFIGVLCVTGVAASGLTSVGTLFGASWDTESIRPEERRWNDEIEKWNTLSAEWGRTWSERHEALYPGTIDPIDVRSYCDARGCWESDMFSFTYTSPTGAVVRVDKESSDADLNDTEGRVWSAANGGQVLNFSDTDGTSWESSNFGQVLRYTDARGNVWESSNFGQVVTFTGVDGTSWESSNFGQVLTNSDSAGNVWRDSNFGQVGSFTNGDGEEWEVTDTR